MKNLIEARGGHKPPLNRMLQACTPKGQDRPVKQRPVYVFRCYDCNKERKLLDAAIVPQFCPWCGSVAIAYDRTE